MAIQATNVADIMRITLRDLGKFKWSDIGATDLQEYVVLPRVLKKEKVLFQSGTEMQFNVMVADGGQARHIGLFEKDVISVPDVMRQGTNPWRHTRTFWALERRLVAMNRDPSKIVDYAKTQRIASMISYAKKFETAFCGLSSATDDTTPFGIFNYIVPKVTGSSASTSTGEFGGTVPSGFTTVSGLSSTDYPMWANWTHQYVEVSESDAVDKMDLAALKTEWSSPVPIPDYASGGHRCEIWCNTNTYRAYRKVARDQNENLGYDVNAGAGKATFNGYPIRRIPALDANTNATDPIIGIDWAHFGIGVLEGEYLNEDGPIQLPDQPSVTKMVVDTTWNTYCRSRRNQWILAK